jgi:hypothetical protein
VKNWISAIALLSCVAIQIDAQVQPEFRLPDVNQNSIRKNSQVSPRDYLLQVSGYYFGSAT